MSSGPIRVFEKWSNGLRNLVVSSEPHRGSGVRMQALCGDLENRSLSASALHARTPCQDILINKDVARLPPRQALCIAFLQVALR
jgi:hypothetical protein